MSPTRLHPDDLAALARLVADELADRVLAQFSGAVNGGRALTHSRLLTAAEVGELVGLNREAVYRKADELGAVRIGTGPKPRLRFDAERVAAALATCSASRESSQQNLPRRQRSRQRQSRNTSGAIPLLPVRGV